MAQADLARIGLGTVQFGLDYGVSNSAGRVAPDEVANILALAGSHGLKVLDTAPGYGVSEAVLGQVRPVTFDYKMVSKTPAFSKSVLPSDASDQIRSSLMTSLERLRVPSLHGLLIHHVTNLLQPGGAGLWGMMGELVAAGLVERIGASVYTPEQAFTVLERFGPTLIQLPLNLFDQRAIHSGLLARLAAAGVEVHSRSVFLQGLLLMSEAARPAHFAPLAPQFLALDRLAQEHGLTRLGVALWFALRTPGVATVLVGVTSVAELEQILATVAALPDQPPDPQACAALRVTESRYIDPSQWHALSEES